MANFSWGYMHGMFFVFLDDVDRHGAEYQGVVEELEGDLVVGEIAGILLPSGVW